MHILDIFAILELAESLFNVLLDTLSKELVGRGSGVGGSQDLVPRRLEDAELRGGIGDLEELELLKPSNILFFNASSLLQKR